MVRIPYYSRRNCVGRVRGVSELVALLIVVVVGIATTLVYFQFVGGLFGSLSPKVKQLDVSALEVEVMQKGTYTYIEGISFGASYIYRWTVAIHNVGTEPITLGYRFIKPRESALTICTSNSCDVYDPYALASTYTQLPSNLAPNQIVQVSFVILSKRDLLSLGYTPFILEITGSAPDGSAVKAYVSFPR